MSREAFDPTCPTCDLCQGATWRVFLVAVPPSILRRFPKAHAAMRAALAMAPAGARFTVLVPLCEACARLVGIDDTTAGPVTGVAEDTLLRLLARYEAAIQPGDRVRPPLDLGDLLR